MAEKSETDARELEARERERQARQQPSDYDEREINVQSGDPALREELERTGRKEAPRDVGSGGSVRLAPSHDSD